MANLENILHLPTEESLNKALGEIATAIKNSGGGGGGAPAEHEHKIQDIYVPFVTGGEWNTNGYVMTEEIEESLKNNAEAVEYLINNNKTVAQMVERTAIAIGSEQPITDSSGNQYLYFMAAFNRLVLRTKMSPNDSIQGVKFGTVATLPADFDGEDTSGVTISQADAQTQMSIGEHTYPYTAVENVEDIMALVSGQMTEDPSIAAAMLDKYGGSTVAITVDMLGQDGQPMGDEDLTFEKVFSDDMLSNLFMVQSIVLVPYDDVADIIESITSEQELKEAIKLHLDAVADENIQKKTVFDEVAKMIKEGKLQLISLANESEYENLDYEVRQDPNVLCLIQEE